MNSTYLFRCGLNRKLLLLTHRYNILPKTSLINCLKQKSRFYSSSITPNFGAIFTSISQSTPVQAFQSFLIDCHEYSGLPWWSVITLVTLGIRCVIVLPLAIHQSQVVARLLNINAEMSKLAPELNKEVNVAKKMYNWDEKTAKRVYKNHMKGYFQKFVVRDNCHPFKTVLLAIFQVPVWICFSFSLRNLTYIASFHHPNVDLVLENLKTEGMLWFQDLTVPDMVYIPLLLTLVNISLIELQALRQIGKGTWFQKLITNVMRGVVLFIGFAAAINPSSVSYYWLCSSTFGLMQNILLLQPKIRRFLNIPATVKESQMPFRDIANNLKARFKR